MLGPLERSHLENKVRMVPEYELDRLRDNFRLNGHFDAIDVVTREKNRRAAIREEERRREEALRRQERRSSKKSAETQSSEISPIRMGEGRTGWECDDCGNEPERNYQRLISGLKVHTAELLGLLDWEYTYEEDTWAYEQHSIIECPECSNYYVAFTD